VQLRERLSKLQQEDQMRKAIVPILLSFLIVSCATTYQSKGLFGGFSETQLDTDLFTVIFQGNGYTSSERASDFALLRCADLSAENGFSYFKIIDSQSNIKTTYTVSTDTNFNASSYGNTLYGNATSTTNIKTTERPIIHMTVRMLKEKTEGAYSASFIAKSIRGKYKMEN
jgi:hypothetical protein